MIKDFTKLETFLVVVKERSFSKASAKLGISQPAVTQQIKFLEEQLDAKLIERKKNGVRLTKEGEEVYKIVQRISKCIQNAEQELLKIINKEITFIIGASFTIGNYILPQILPELKKIIQNDILLQIDVSKNIVDNVLEKKYDLGLIESPVMKEGLVYREWMDDELVLFSNTKLPKYVRPEELYKFNWICREEGSHTRKMVAEVFENLGLSCKKFNVISEVSSSTAVVNSILRSPVDKEHPTVSIISRYAIEDEVKQGRLFEAKIKGVKIKRKLYICYLKERKNDPFLMNIVDHLFKLRH
ncbi:LysR family transcriptional regulator [Nitratiruptor sp. SB155-2]|uniref:LysR family transcriptional regulator n=1 Tax=Nitratiruptor sp. (strain SB155-2) TaxID=387092 RepID=UPI0001587102|nr:LysR family transcriptional regulator [Nitratiruptor sp. SB155-2]BAF70579.1 transcriptional regulator, LysR family [Nitratiruptor sp. SB155-2]